ncbi:diiron oxygenase [Nocardia sp. IBHARD005]|uniref:diiron oxygenase n=1 Tax=Nocardia sp. IBHARD005 TaxID=3457765 RepID=UPI004058E9DF
MTLSSDHDTLQSLSEGSVVKHFDPCTDIDWDSPAKSVWRLDGPVSRYRSEPARRAA